jgi:hypothetical protein
MREREREEGFCIEGRGGGGGKRDKKEKESMIQYDALISRSIVS